VQRRGDFARDDRRVGDRGEIDPGNPGVATGFRRRDLAGESRLAASAGAGQREQTCRADQPRQLAELVAATDEPRQVDR
jgi:hypothetical protein